MIKAESALGDALFISDIAENFKTSKIWTDTTHFHADSEVHIILNGDAVIEIDGEDVQVKAGDVCLLAPQSSHYPKSFSSDLEKTNFYFSLVQNHSHIRAADSFSEYAYYSNIFKSVKKYLIISDTELVSVVKRLIIEDISNENEHVFCTLLSLFFITLARRIRERLLLEKDQPIRTSLESEAVFKQRKTVEAFFQNRYGEEVGIEDLARDLCLSTPQTHRIVKRFFDDGFKKTLMKQRIEHACMLIKQQDLTLTEIAYRCGYTSYNGFLSAFKNHVGKSPKEYEKAVR